MIILNIEETQNVSGGFLPALVAFITILTVPKIVNDHRKEYNEWGHNLGEFMWEYNHPYDPNNPQGVYK